MASIWLDWREAQGGDLPMVCATCGDEATDLVERRLSTVRPGLMCVVRTKVTVLLPYCERHIVASWNGFMRVRARSIRKDGITLGQVAEDFVDAVQDYREHPGRYRRPRTKAAARREGEEGWEDGPPIRRPRKTTDSSRLAYGILMTVLVLVCVTVLGACGFGLLAFTVLRSGGPSVGRPPGIQQPAGPQRPPFRR